MEKLRCRYIFDIILSVLLIAEMFFEVTGDFLHELLGCAFFVTIIAHLILSRKWMKVTARQVASGKRLKAANKLRLVLAIGLAISFVALVASSIAISLIVIDVTGVNLAGSARQTWIAVHTASSYALCIFTIAHVLVHWASICSVFKIPYNPARRQAISTGASAVVAVSAVALGVAGAQAIEAVMNPAPVRQNANPQDMVPRDNEVPLAEAAPPEQKAPKGDKPSKPKIESNGEAPTQSAPPNSSPAGEQSSPSGSQPSASTGYCTLCKLRCPLSSPQCNRPHQAGLI